MKVIDLFECARPLRWHNNDDDYPYSIGGTGFLIRSRKRHFIITAKHCLKNRDMNSLAVEIYYDSGSFNALSYLHLLEGEQRWQDIAVFEFDPKTNSTTDLACVDFLDFDYFSGLRGSLGKDAIFAFRGYPTDINAPDYEEKTLRCNSYSADGRWDGRWIKPRCGAITLTGKITDHGLTNLDGISGAPVFELRRTAHGIAHRFAGVVIETNPTTVRFIDGRVVVQAMDRICA
jgi:hypothetical protein